MESFLPGPVQNPLMISPHMSDGQGYNSSIPGLYAHQTPTKGSPHPSSGLYNYSGSQNVSPLSNYQGPGQTLNRPPMGPVSMVPLQQGSLPQMPPPSQTSAAVSTSAGSVLPGANLPALSNWQYGQALVSQPTTGSQENHFAHIAGTTSTQPLSSSGNTNPPTSYQYVASPGGPPVQNSYMKPPLGPPPTGCPTSARPFATPAGLPISSAPPHLLNSAMKQEGTTQSPPVPPNSKMGRSVGYSYPTLPPGYQNTSSPGAPGMQSPSLQCTGGPQPFPQPAFGTNHLAASMGGLSLQPEGLRTINLLQERNILPPAPLQAPVPNLHEDIQKLNCNPELFRCTLTNIPQTQALLNKAKLPLGLLLHPFKDLSQLPVVTSSTIVRCRSCRTYINPFVSFLDQRRWKCNLCYRVNDVPEEFMYNPVTRVYGEPHKRPEVQNATIEFMAPSEYMVSYLQLTWFITFDSTIHFYSLQEGLSQPQMLIVSDIEDVFIPMPENLLVNLNENKELIQDLLRTLPQMFTKSLETQSALGPALQAAFKLMSPTGGRITVFQTQLPSVGVGALKSREEPNQKASAKDIHLTPSTDFYKKLALDCSGQQVAVDLFLLSGQYSDLASLGCISRYSAGSVYYYQSYHHRHNPVLVEKLQKELKRYLTRKIGFEAVMRIRCTKGLSIHTFHGNFFVRSTDLLSLPNINPDAGYAVQMSVEESLTDMQVVSFQSALLYTSSKGERRIRVHTMCLPVVTTLNDVYLGADVHAITGLLANMAVDRSVSASLSDARDALVNAVIDSLSAYRASVLSIQQPGLMAPYSLRLFPLHVLALLKQKAFQTGTNTRLDERIFTMCQVKNQPLVYLMLMTHPNLYRVDNLTDEGALNIGDRKIPQPPILQLSVEKLSRDGAYLMDAGSVMLMWIGKNCGHNFISQVLGVPSYASVPQNMTHLAELDTAESVRTIAFISWLREQRPFFPILYIIRDESSLKSSFLQNMIEDRTESALSYYEFLLHIQQQVNK
uniref:SEC24 homolog A, COPII coat complex component n=1 Tax=Sphenodon punctatus TaxID=8508 RepID=A0A8D0GZG4_SPHPU